MQGGGPKQELLADKHAMSFGPSTVQAAFTPDTKHMSWFSLRLR